MSKLTARLKNAANMAPVQEGLREGERLLGTLKDAAEKGDLKTANGILAQLKIMMTNFPSLPPGGVDTPSAQAERTLARDVLEVAVFISAREGDRRAFARHMAQLKPYHFEISSTLPHSPNRYALLGLNLLYLLVENKLADFHSELELMSDADRSNECIVFPVRLEQYLMVGSYDQVLSARSHVPHKYYSYFLDSLADTVREAIADCMSAAYDSMSIAEAQKMTMSDSPVALKEFIATYHSEWKVGRDAIEFQHEAAGSKSSEVPSMRIITETLSYATELERIV